MWCCRYYGNEKEQNIRLILIHKLWQMNEIGLSDIVKTNGIWIRKDTRIIFVTFDEKEDSN